MKLQWSSGDQLLLSFIFSKPGSKENYFYSFSFGRAVAGIYWPISHLN